MPTKNFCIKIDKTLIHPDYDTEGIWISENNIIDYKQLEWVANEEHHLDSFEDDNYVYIYSENDSIEDLQNYINYVGEWHEVYLTIESNVNIDRG